MKRFVFTIVACLFVSLLVAQSSNPPASGGFKMFYEKTYIHTDRSYYAAGEDIWFKAYLLNAQYNELMIGPSANLYVELISPDSKVISREVIHLDKGLAKGDFKLADDAVAGNYRIRAYTNWMKNFDDNFIFEKKIEVVADPNIKVTGRAPSVPTLVAAVNRKDVKGVYRISFFPEGGSIVTGVSCRMAFKAEDVNGKSVNVKGRIVGSKGDSVAAFESTNLGMGNFTFVPKAGEAYTAKGKYNDVELFSEDLPLPMADGFVLSVNEENETTVAATVMADNSTITAHTGHALMIAARHTGKITFKDTITLNGPKAVMHIPKASLFEGVNAITLYDENLRPHCERLIYVNKKEQLNVDVAADQPSYAPKQNASITVTVTDAQQQPVHAHLSMAATDGGLIPVATENIASYLLLQSEIKGNIENPAQYFDPNNPNRFQQIDILLQTQGWREYLWRRIADSKSIISNMYEPGVTISGRVRQTFVDKGKPGVNITLQSPDARGDKLWYTKTDSLGRYFLDGLPLYGLQNIKLTARDDKNKKDGMILLDSVFGKPYPVKDIADIVYDTSAIHKKFWQEEINRKNLMELQQKRDAGDLGNVTVKAQTKIEQLVDGGAMKYGNNDSLFIIGPEDAQYQTVEYFILKRYPGAYGTADGEGVYFMADGKKVYPRFKVDGREETASQGSIFNTDATTGRPEGSFTPVQYYSIPINKVKQIYIQPLLGAMNNIIYVIHLDLLPGALDPPDVSLINTMINGYYEARKYYVPNFSSFTGNVSKTDVRSTIFWAPDVETDASGKATIPFNNSDAKTKIFIDVQGISDKGLPVVGKMQYEVK